jgi:predicted Zn finger-like uncharacterized protein
MKLTKAIQSITEMLDKCPECGSDNIANEDQASDAGLEISCHNCSHQWLDDERVQQNKIYDHLRSSGLPKEAQSIKNMSTAEYREFLKEHFDIASLNQ